MKTVSLVLEFETKKKKKMCMIKLISNSQEMDIDYTFMKILLSYILLKKWLNRI